MSVVTRLTLTSEQLDLLDDVLAYYRLAYPWDDDETESNRIGLFGQLEDKIEQARYRVAALSQRDRDLNLVLADISEKT